MLFSELHMFTLYWLYWGFHIFVSTFGFLNAIVYLFIYYEIIIIFNLLRYLVNKRQCQQTSLR